MSLYLRHFELFPRSLSGYVGGVSRMIETSELRDAAAEVRQPGLLRHRDAGSRTRAADQGRPFNRAARRACARRQVSMASAALPPGANDGGARPYAPPLDERLKGFSCAFAFRMVLSVRAMGVETGRSRFDTLNNTPARRRLQAQDGGSLRNI